MCTKKNVSLDSINILVTGSSGFIGSYLVQRLLKETMESVIVGIDSVTNYNPISLKEWRLREIEKVARRSKSSWIFIKEDISDKQVIDSLFKTYNFSIVVNLAAQAGVRYSISNPEIYIKSNIVGFFNILEACRNDNHLEHLVFASSSSVYGNNNDIPFHVEDKTDHPVSLYAATKKSDELMAYTYSHLFQIPITGLRFFTVYGPAGRTDMFYFIATDRLIRGQKVQIYNHGDCMRDFTYISDIVEGIFRVIKKAPLNKSKDSIIMEAPYSLYNIGGGKPEKILDFITVLQEELLEAGLLRMDNDYDFSSYWELVPMQPGDVIVTYADSYGLEKDFGFRPQTGIREGLREFVGWYKNYAT